MSIPSWETLYGLSITDDDKDEPSQRIVGTCTHMCPTSEYDERTTSSRTHSHQLHSLEIWPSPTPTPTPTPTSCIHPKRDMILWENQQSFHVNILPIRRYHRSSTAHDTDTKSTEIRTLTALQETVTHLLTCVWMGRSDVHFLQRVIFINDRLRAVVKEVRITCHSHSPITTLNFLLRLVRYHLIIHYLLSGLEDPGWNSRLHRQQIHDVIALACSIEVETGGGAVQSTATSTSTATATSTATSTSSHNGHATQPHIIPAYIMVRVYGILMHLHATNWLEIHPYLQIFLSSRAPSDAATFDTTSTSTSTSTSTLFSLPPPIRYALAIYTAYHTQNTFAFFQLCERMHPRHLTSSYTSTSTSTSTSHDMPYDPFIGCIVTQHYLTMQTHAIRIINNAYMKQFWFPLRSLLHASGFHDIDSASIVCRSLYGLPVKRPDYWENLTIAEKEEKAPDETKKALNETGATCSWAVQIKMAVMSEPDPIILRAYHDRALRMRWRECGISQSDSATATATSLTDHKTSWEEIDDTVTSITSATSIFFESLLPWLQ